MGIAKKGRIVGVTYPNGNSANLTLLTYDGVYIPAHYGSRDYNVVTGLLRYNLVENNKAFEFDIPPVDSTYTWQLHFSGSFHGQPLPPIEISVRKFETSSGNYQVNINIPNIIVDGVTILGGLNGSGYFTADATKWYFLIGHGNPNDPEETNVFLGLTRYGMSAGDICPLSDSRLYWNSSTEVEYSYPFGPASDPDKYESKPTDASSATMSDSSDIIGIDTLPSAVYAGGLFRIYEMNNTQMTALSNELTDPSIIESLVRTVTSPMDYIISLKAMPVTFNGFNTSLRLGNYTSQSVGSVKQVNNFLVEVDCGSVAIPTFFDSFLDWSPYTSVTAYLPFIGYVSLNIDKFVGNNVKVRYRVDAASGDCIAFVSNNTGLIATYSGNCAYNLPLRANDSSQIVAGLYSALAGLVSGNGGATAQGVLQLAEGVYKPNMVSTSGLSANAGGMCNRKPYLIIERPLVSMPRTYPNNTGYMARISARLSNLHGFTIVEDIHLDNVIATREEKAELETLLKNGVVLP